MIATPYDPLAQNYASLWLRFILWGMAAALLLCLLLCLLLMTRPFPAISPENAAALARLPALEFELAGYSAQAMHINGEGRLTFYARALRRIEDEDHIVVRDVTAGRVVVGIYSPCFEAPDLALSSDGQYLACRAGDALAVYHPRSRSALARLPLDSSAATATPVFDQRGAYLVYFDFAAYDPRVAAGSGYFVWQWQSGEHYPVPAPLLDSLSRPAPLPALSPEGRYMAFRFGYEDNQRAGLRIWDLQAQRVHADLLELPPFFGMVLGPEARTVLTMRRAEAGFQLWDVASGQPMTQFSAPEARLTSPQFHPDGGLLLFPGPTGRVTLWAVP